jgi:hypothetical protein
MFAMKSSPSMESTSRNAWIACLNCSIVKQGNRLVMELPGFFGVRIYGIPHCIDPHSFFVSSFPLGDFIQQARLEFLIEPILNALGD